MKWRDYMQVAVANDSQIDNFIKFLELNNGELINFEVRRIEFDPYSVMVELNDKNIQMTSSYLDDGLLLCDKWFIPKKELRTIWVYKDGMFSFVVKYRNDKDGIYYEMYFWNVNRKMFNLPKCTNFFDDDDEFTRQYEEIITKRERQLIEENLQNK